MRLLIYSHDTFGLGHLRRCRAIAHALVEAYSDLSVLILSGSPFVKEFTFLPRVEYLQMPAVQKLKDGTYASSDSNLSIEETLKQRSEMILKNAQNYRPDFLLVDKEPWGLKGELKDTLSFFREKKTPCILGVRDVLDAPNMLKEEWERRKNLEAVSLYYSHIWIYGLASICNPFEGVGLHVTDQKKIAYTGYLRRKVTPSKEPFIPPFNKNAFLLLMAGGGGDGNDLVESVLSAYEYAKIHHIDLLPIFIILGPFMDKCYKEDFEKRAGFLKSQMLIQSFTKNIESYIEAAEGLITMGGYNSFCELLSFDKRAIIVPRTIPRKEQWVRANCAQKLGLSQMLQEREAADPQLMIQALKSLKEQPAPSEASIPALLDGLPNIVHLFKKICQK